MRLIDADAFDAFSYKGTEGCADCFDSGVIFTLEQIDNAPTIDAEPVVRCEDCIHHTDEEPGMVYCPAVIGGWVSNGFFCGDGERGEK